MARRKVETVTVTMQFCVPVTLEVEVIPNPSGSEHKVVSVCTSHINCMTPRDLTEHASMDDLEELDRLVNERVGKERTNE